MSHDADPALTWREFVEDVLGDLSDAEAARRSGIDKSVFGRWRRGQGTTAEVAARFARAFDADVLHALLAVGVVTAQEVGVDRIAVPTASTLRTASADDLGREVTRRLREAERRTVS